MVDNPVCSHCRILLGQKIPHLAENIVWYFEQETGSFSEGTEMKPYLLRSDVLWKASKAKLRGRVRTYGGVVSVWDWVVELVPEKVKNSIWYLVARPVLDHLED